MRHSQIEVAYPESKDDCTSIENCTNCGLLVDYLLEDKIFTCYNPLKSCKILGCFYGR